MSAKRIKELIVRSKAVKLQEENIVLNSYISNRTPKVLITKLKNGQMKWFCQARKPCLGSKADSQQGEEVLCEMGRYLQLCLGRG